MVEKVMNEVDVKLFYEDSYIEEFEAQVVSCEQSENEYRIVLDQTAFFPEGGGQYADTGWLNGTIEVLDVQENEGLIYHITKEPIAEGSTVVGRINFEERFDKMQQHTAEHIVSGIIHEAFGYDNVGFHLGADVVTMDFNGEFSAADLRNIEKCANEAVAANVVVETRFLQGEELAQMEYRSKIDFEGLVRIVVIPGYDACACCAPHVFTTGEIGLIKLVGAEKYKGGMRVSMVCGMRALADYNIKEKAVKDISVMLSSQTEYVAEAVKKLMSQLNMEKAKVSRLMASYVEGRLKNVNRNESVVFLYEADMEINYLRNFVNGAMELNDGVCCGFSGNELDGYSYVIGSKSVDVSKLAKELNAEFSGKGGGKTQMVQGSFKAELECVKAFIKSYVET